jgi:antitoxin component HigA of HigAB toxin-antitoxin module
LHINSILYKLANIANLYKKDEFTMSETIFTKIRAALEEAPRNQYTAEMHLQMIKYADELKSLTAKDFCEGVGLKQSFGTEFSKMRNLTCRLNQAGMDTDKI